MTSTTPTDGATWSGGTSPTTSGRSTRPFPATTPTSRARSGKSDWEWAGGNPHAHVLYGTGPEHLSLVHRAEEPGRPGKTHIDGRDIDVDAKGTASLEDVGEVLPSVRTASNEDDTTGRWLYGGCAAYAVGTRELFPHTSLGYVMDNDEPDRISHVFAHDETHVYDANGKQTRKEFKETAWLSQ